MIEENVSFALVGLLVRLKIEVELKSSTKQPHTPHFFSFLTNAMFICSPMMFGCRPI